MFQRKYSYRKRAIIAIFLSTAMSMPVTTSIAKGNSVSIERWTENTDTKTSNTNTYSQEFISMLKEINSKNEKIDAPNSDLNRYKYDFKNGKPLFTEDDVSKVEFYDGENPEIAQSLSSADAKSEVEWLFRLLRTEYGLYKWFGGDEVFELAQSKIVDEIKKSDSISIDEYQNLLVENLGFIEDTHFMIGENNFRKNYALFSDETKPFYRLNDKFYTDSQYTQAVVSVNGQSPEKFIKRAIGQDGKITWFLYALVSTDDDNYSVKLKIGNTEETVQLKKTDSSITKRFEEDYRYTVENEIPYIQINFMLFGNGDRTGGMATINQDIKQEFLSKVEEIKKYNAAVIDISHNPGGNGGLPDEWFKLYTGQKLQTNYLTLQIRPEEPLRSDEQANAYDEIKISEGFKVDGHYYVNCPDKQFVKNQSPILFILTSGGTASAAEGFLDAVHNIENTVVIGANTGGVLTNAANYGFRLPESGLYLQMGECLYYWNTDYFREGYGMEPDLYLTGENLQKRLNLFFETYVNIE